ncbi:MAG: hypothetical protein KAH25_03930 [Bacteroidales bacterium]|nr:hypothetical protein [Bacteroidales bacterium]
MANIYSLKDYEALAYDFAIRNPRVIELLKSPLNDKVADELLNTYGINIKVEIYDSYNGDYLGKKNSLEELCLDYPHLADAKGYESSGLYAGDYDISLCKKLKKVIHPKSSTHFKKLESGDIAIKRIRGIFNTQAGHLDRIMDGRIFEYYDKHILGKKNPKINKKKISDIELIKTYIKPSFYSKLLPKYINIFEVSIFLPTANTYTY